MEMLIFRRDFPLGRFQDRASSSGMRIYSSG
jgi:hypothetical protein